MQLPELKERINKIKALLDDPQEGHMTWCEALGWQMTELIQRWQGQKNGETAPLH